MTGKENGAYWRDCPLVLPSCYHLAEKRRKSKAKQDRSLAAKSQKIGTSANRQKAAVELITVRSGGGMRHPVDRGHQRDKWLCVLCCQPQSAEMAQNQGGDVRGAR